VLTGMAFAIFADTPVDVAVLEVGVGGRLDCTNVADGVVAVITPIAIDHTRLLGSTIEEIAGEKAGIIKPGAVAVLAQQSLPAAEVLDVHAPVGGADDSGGVVPAGQSMTWTEKQAVSLRLGNPGGITLTVDGQQQAIKTVLPVTLSYSPQGGATPSASAGSSSGAQSG